MTTPDSRMNRIEPFSVTVDDLQTETVYERVIVTVPGDETENDRMNLVEASGVLDFWDDAEEDVYSEADGDDI